MALSGKLQADFSTFVTAVNDAEVKLRGFEGGAAKVETALSRMVDSFTGRKVIAEATLMAEAVQRLDGQMKLTDQEMAHIGQTALDAADKFAAWGREIPKEIQGLIDMSKAMVDARQKEDALRKEVESWGPTVVKAEQATTKMGQSLTLLNSGLAAIGVGGPIAAATREVEGLVRIFTEGTAAMGGLAKGATVVATAFASWEIGRKIAELTGSDKIIGDSTAKLLGWGDMAAEVAGAKADVLAKATATAGRSVTDLTEAMKINADEAARMAKHWDDVEHAAERAARAQVNEFNEAVKWGREVEARQKAQEEALRRNEEITARWADKVHTLELSFKGVTAGLLGLNAEEQKRTQAGFALAAGQGPAAAAIDTSNPFAVWADDLKKANEELQRNIALGEDRLIAELHQKDQIAAANQKFLDSILKAAVATDTFAQTLVKPSLPGLGPTINPWSTLTPKPIEVRPITPGSFGFSGATGAGPPVQVNVSGVWDPATVRQMTDAVSEELMRRSQRKF